MATACVAFKGGRMVDRSSNGRAAEADGTAVVRDCTTREDADNGIKKSISKRKNDASTRKIVAEDSDFYEEAGSSSSDDETFPNSWLTDDNETVEMAALVPFRLRSELQNMYGVSSSFPHLLLLENGPKAVEIEEETWWRVYWSIEEVQKAKSRQDGSNRMVDPYDCCTRAVHELCAKMNRKERVCDMAASFDRGPYHQRQFNKWMWENFYDNRCCFPTLGCLCNLVRLKHELWNRYGFFYDVDVIAEVFPENELASWVMKAYNSYSIAKIEFRDEEMVCERSNWSFDDRCPRRMRSYEEELRVLARRARWRRFNDFGEPGEVMYLPFIRQRIYAGEEVPRCLLIADDDIVARHVKEREKRRNPDKAQFDAKEPDRRKFEEDEQIRKHQAAVSYQS